MKKFLVIIFIFWNCSFFQKETSDSTQILPLAVLLRSNSASSSPSEYLKYYTAGEELQAGSLTVLDSSNQAYVKTSENLSTEKVTAYEIGQAVFEIVWDEARLGFPNSDRDGLGPLSNANSCDSCHRLNGRGAPPGNNRIDNVSSTLVRLSDRNGNPLQNYGDQLQPVGITGINGEGIGVLTYTTIKGSFPDGEVYELIKPTISFTNLNYGTMPSEILTSIRVTPSIIGLGLLEAITEKSILKYVDENDKDKDGISGRANYVKDFKTNTNKLGRFGWKANQPNLNQQNAAAFLGDIGITTPTFSTENCTASQTACSSKNHGGTPEINAAKMKQLLIFSLLVGVPVRRNYKSDVVLKGKMLFNQIGCNKCHIPSYTTGVMNGYPELSNQKIYPYTDLLLHDMGDGLSDGRPDFLATGKEWRTPPLWGIGLVQNINGHSRFLHDGRARGFQEAILWHGGEALQSKQSYKKLNKSERQSILKFLESL